MKKFVAFLIVLLVGCTASVKTDNNMFKELGEITLYITVPENTKIDVMLTLESIKLVNDKDNSINLLSSPYKLSTKALRGKQRFIGDFLIPQGKYKKMILTFRDPVLKEKKEYPLELQKEFLSFNVDFKATKKNNFTYFILWDLTDSIKKKEKFIPKFVISPSKEPPVYNRLMYILNSGSDNLTVVDRYIEKVIGTIRVGLSPVDVARGTGENSTKLFVANLRSNSISVINMESNTVEREINITTGEGPTGVVSVRISPSTEWLMVANYKSNNLSIIDTQNYTEIGKIDVGSGPYRLATDPPYQELVNSVFLNPQYLDTVREYFDNYRTVYVANKNSNTISIIRINRRTRDVKLVGEISVEWEPVNLYVDSSTAKLYVASHDADKLTVIDLIEIMKGNFDTAKTTITDVGYSVVDIVAESTVQRLYVLKSAPPELSILRYISDSVDLQTAVPTYIGIIPLDGVPERLLISPEGTVLYVIEKEKGMVYLIDKLSYKILKTVSVGRGPTNAIIISN